MHTCSTLPPHTVGKNKQPKYTLFNPEAASIQSASKAVPIRQEGHSRVCVASKSLHSCDAKPKPMLQALGGDKTRLFGFGLLLLSQMQAILLQASKQKLRLQHTPAAGTS